ncbi:MAG TPA: hypothetical protein VN957_19840, partial [Chthoniobacterales bacterium]|nr:hypothetical protein [Chthoniobacterales bacterium]
VRVGHDVTGHSVAYFQVNGHGIASIAKLVGIITSRLEARAHTGTQRHLTGTCYQDWRALKNVHKFILMRMGMARRRDAPWWKVCQVHSEIGNPEMGTERMPDPILHE